MQDYSEHSITTADARTLLLHNQHVICTAIEEAPELTGPLASRRAPKQALGGQSICVLM
jgi:hypothetical protein